MTLATLYLVGAMLCSFLITYFVIPSVIDLAYKKNLLTSAHDQNEYSNKIPGLGGIGIFIGVLITFTAFSSQEIFMQYKFILTAYLLLFFMGLKDELVPMDKKIKLVLQVIAALILAAGDIRIHSLHGILGIETLSIYTSYAITVFFIVGLTNAFNLIDGIDGLAGGLGGINCITLGILLLWLNDFNYALLAFSIAGSLIAFLRFNFASSPKKILMGDAGSLLLGLTVTILIIQFTESPLAYEKLSIVSPIGIVAGIIAIPVFDILRLGVLALLKGESPFNAKKNHLHHEFLNSGLNHKKSSLLLYFGNVLLIANVLVFKSETLMTLIILTIFLGTLIIQFLFIWRFKYRSREVNMLEKELVKLEEENVLI